jgi:hypothetical protein
MISRTSLHNKDRWLVEDYLTIHPLNPDSSQENPERKGHISIFHLSWLPRPVVASGIPVYRMLFRVIRCLQKNNSHCGQRDPGHAKGEVEAVRYLAPRAEATIKVARISKGILLWKNGFTV